MNHEPIIQSQLQIDWYKLLIQQFAFLLYRHVRVTFGYTQRSQVRIPDIVPIEAVREEVECTRQLQYTDAEIAWLAERKIEGVPVFVREFLEYLRTSRMPEVNIGLREDGGAFTLESVGDWCDVSPWETKWLNIVNTLYYRELLKLHGVTTSDAWAEGDRRLSNKMAMIRENPSLKFV
ncbi:MAG: Nicotinate phosphoribosyltransferase, partial [Candidatus Uhrbacteria bacterium GW2011_GWD2_52_7]